jgi:hypothetical protein
MKDSRISFRSKRKAVARSLYLLGVAFLLAIVLTLAAEAVDGGAPPPPVPSRLSHPAAALKDEAGRNVLITGKPISTRRTCGEKCHDYDFITNSFHFQQGKSEMDRNLLSSHGAAPFSSSPGMFGKFSIIPNRQLTHAGIQDPSDADMSQPEWLTKCGGCHTGGGISEYDLEGRPLLGPDAKATGPLDPSYTIRERNSGQVVPWDWEKSGVAEEDCFLCHVPKASRGARRKEMAPGNFRWANNATLSETGIVSAGEDGTFRYNRAAGWTKPWPKRLPRP